MIGIGSMVKWGIALAIFTMLAVGANKVYEYHLDALDNAVISAQREIAIASATSQRTREENLRKESTKEKQRIERKLRIERDKVDDLERMLLIDHDLDRLLQIKPERILVIINKGTADYFKELEEITQ